MRNNTNTVKRIVDIVLCILLLCLMAYQVTGEEAHEWIGISIFIVVIIHQILNRKWYGALFKGKYSLYRTAMTVVNILLIFSFVLTALCGMSMSSYAVPFLYGMGPVHFVRRAHLSLSHWSFVFMGLHLGLHVRMLIGRRKYSEKTGLAVTGMFAVLAGIGFWLFLRNNMPDYLFFKVPFAFLDYDKAGVIVYLENMVMLVTWVFAGHQLTCLLANPKTEARTNRRFRPIFFLAGSLCVGLLLQLLFPVASENSNAWMNNNSGVNAQQESVSTRKKDNQISVADGYVLISGGSYLMGSPESENWRIDDETQHEVTIASFYMDPYETTQREYMRLMGENPSTFEGDNLPLETISWLEACRYANAKSIDAGLQTVYEIDGDTVTWNKGANGYRLPTEAEWEYACRAGTLTPFNTEHSLSADNANFYGHYPYEIEENYFDNSVLEARPGQYRGTTVEIGSFEPNAWGLYECHGNVNEWCWDYYGAYNLNDTDNPSGPLSGTRHSYRGGGWNDFAKNMRSAYRAAAQADFSSFNLGVRLVRNASDSASETVTAEASLAQNTGNGKVLIAYFSWGGNTRGIAEEIQRQTSADLFEIILESPYSTDYNTVLMEAQEDQHKQARPVLSSHVEHMETYDTILLGYPNWWASIPMPIASFLEEYDFSGKRIIPFCSHGGGRFGQSLSAIAKLVPDAIMGQGLSIHYSGGESMPEDVNEWLNNNGITQ